MARGTSQQGSPLNRIALQSEKKLLALVEEILKSKPNAQLIQNLCSELSIEYSQDTVELMSRILIQSPDIMAAGESQNSNRSLSNKEK